MNRTIISIIIPLLLLLCLSTVQAQVDKGVTSSGKEVDCSTIDPSVDKTVSEHGKIVTHPRVTRNGKLITDDCGCPVSIDCTNCTDTVNCISITMSAPILSGDVTSAVLQIFSDAGYTTQVGSNITAAVSGGKITATAANLSCYTKYYLRLTLNNNSNCTFDWADSTRDMTMEKVTTCAVASVRALSGGSDLSHEHLAEGTTDQIDSVYDHQGNAYAVVQIGDQCWLRQNMRCTTSPRQSSVNLTQGAATNDLDYLNAKYYDRTDASMYTINERGYLYNWAAAMDTTFSNSSQLPKNTDFPNHRGICPSGWHLPTVTEWNTMEKEYLTGNDGITPISDAALTAANTYDPVLGIPNPRGKGSGKLTASCGWIEDNEHQTAPGNYSYPDRNISGFSALPIGCMGVEDGEHEEFYYLGESSDFWTATSYDQYSTWARFMLNNTEGIHHNNLDGNKNYGFAVRCVRDVIIPEMSVCEDTTFGTVTLKEIQNVEKIEFVQGSTVVKTISNPASEIFVSDLAEGSYKIKATSSTEDTVVEDVRVKHTYTFCLVGALRANEMGATTTQLDSVKDHQNNWYEVVQIGNQCWLKENMRATTTPSGTNILLGGLGQFVQNNHSKAAFNHSNSVYGIMYNWCAAVDTFNNSGSKPEVAAGTETGSWTCNLPAGNRRGICPEGWHIPSDGEFWELENNTLTGLTPEDSAAKNYGTARSGIGAGNLAAGCEWYPDTKATSPGNYSYTERNLSGFSARPAGTIEDGSQYANLTLAAYFWSSTPYLTTGAFARVVRTNNECTQRGSNHRYNAFSVRCVRDVVECTTPTLSICTDRFGATLNDTIEGTIDWGDGSATVTNPVAGTMHYYDAADTYTITLTVDGGCSASVDVTSEGFANKACTVSAKGANEIYKDGSSTQIVSVSDHEGNSYRVVQIGSQCWLAENMRAVTRPNGDTIMQRPPLSVSDAVPMAYIYDNSPAYFNKYGVLYNWPAAMDSSFTYSPWVELDAEFSNRRGICPSGWHLPTDAEWKTLESGYMMGANLDDLLFRGTGVGQYAGGCDYDWEGSGTTTTPNSYSYADRNITGFSALPSANYFGTTDGFRTIGIDAFFWTANSHSNGQAYCRDLQYNNEGMYRSTTLKYYGFAVRCVRDEQYSMSATADTATCSSIKVSATTTGLSTITSATACAHTTADCSDASPVCADNADIQISGNALTATVKGLDCNTRYYVKITATDGTHTVEDVVSDTTFDRMLAMHTTCTVAAARALDGTSDLSHEHLAEGTTDQIDSVYDHQGNAYAVVQIDNQCWLKENMRCTTSPRQGTGVGQINLTEGTYFNSSIASYYWNPFYYASSDVPLYGYLYNYVATIDTAYAALQMELPAGHRRGICPKGWHVPTDAEWAVLDNKYATNPSSDWARGDYAAKVTTCQYWPATGTIGAPLTAEANAPGDPYAADHNISGLSILPAGGFVGTGLNTPNLTAYLWTATPGASYLKAYARTLYFFDKNMYGSGDVNACDGHSVRCVRDVIIPEFSLCEDTTFGTVTLKEIQNAEKIEFVQGSTVVKTISNPASEIFVNDLAEGNYKVKVTSSTGDTLVDNAYVKHTYTHCTVGQVRVNEMGNNTRLDSVRDHQNNWYEVVQIGNQCWLKQNMRATTKPDGTNILQYPTTGQSTTVPYAYYYNDNSANVRSYGLLYNWAAAMNGAASSAANPSGVRGICPEGWHLPSNAEYTTLMNEVGVTQQSSASGTTGNSGRLVTGCNWNTYDNATSPGNYSYTERNLSGFSAVPSGNYNGGTTFQFEGERTFLWTATASNTELAYYRVIAYDFPVTTYTTNTKYSGRSVRCVRDAEIFPMLGICEDNFYGEIKLTEVENAVRVEVLNSGNAVVNTINNPVSGAVLTGLASDTYTVRAISTSGNFAAETADLVKEYTHCTVTSLRENERGATTTQLDSVRDHQNNWYEVVEIDGKCWLRENMRCTTSPNGRLNVAPSKYWGPNNYYTAPGTAPVYKYGYLYNWSGALDVQETNPASISSLPQNTRGICPEGWHIPVIDEWTALRNALVGESTSQTAYSGNTAYAVNTQISTILADGCDWLSDASANNKPGDYGNSNRNSSKFNWRPSPNYYGSNGTASCNTEGRSGYFWSSSPNPANPGYAYMVYLHYTQTGFISGPDNKSHGRNVRCVRNN